MKNFSYTKTPTLNEQLIKIEDLRKDLLLKPISPKQELQLQWESMISYTHYILALSGIIIPIEHIQKLITPEGKKILNTNEKQAIQIKNALDYLYHNWLVNSEAITAKSLIDFYNHAFTGALNISETDLNNALRYIQINPEYPVVQAALAQLIMFELYPFSEHNELFAHLVFLMFLYKYGYDFRRMITIEEYFFKDMAHYKNLINKLRRQENVSEWIEYVSIAISSQLTNKLRHIEIEKQSTSIIPNTISLNERQQYILKSMEQPGVKINNAMVQKIYKVSQITASRDLSKLTSLGLLFPLGKGRSTYYTKV